MKTYSSRCLLSLLYLVSSLRSKSHLPLVLSIAIVPNASRDLSCDLVTTLSHDSMGLETLVMISPLLPLIFRTGNQVSFHTKFSAD